MKREKKDKVFPIKLSQKSAMNKVNKKSLKSER